MLKMKKDDPNNPDVVSQLRFDTQAEESLAQVLNNFIDHSGVSKDLIQCAVIGIAGPVIRGTVSYQLNINHWCPIRETDLAKETGIKNFKLINDFIANGWGIMSVKDSETYKIFEPEEGILEDTQRLVFGVGTGLGVCQLMRPDEQSTFHCYPSEGGIIKMQLYNDMDREFEDFAFHEKKYESDNIQMFLSGRGIRYIFEFLATKYPKPSKLLNDIPFD